MKSIKLRKQLASPHQTSIYPLFVTYFNTFFHFLYPATKVWRGIMLYPSVSVRLSVRPSVLTISDR